MALNSDQRIARLTVHGDPDGSGTARDHVFEMAAGSNEAPFDYTEGLRTGYIATESGLNTILGELLGDGESQNQTIAVDLGTSQQLHALEFEGWEGSDYQWGDTGDDSQVTATDATGASPIEQLQVLTFVLSNTQIDSLPEELASEVTGSYGPATFEFGMRHPDGPLDPVDVIVESPRTTFTSGSPSKLRGSIEFILAADLGETYDAKGNSKRGTA